MQPLPISVDTVLKDALELVKPISGLKVEEAASSSFDENDYYSSQVQSDWSSPASSRSASDRAAGAFTADFERLDENPPPSASRARRAAHKAPRAQPYYGDEDDDDVYEPEDEDEEDYTPPDPSARDVVEGPLTTSEPFRVPDDDDISDYEPGEVVPDTALSAPRRPPQQAAQLSPRVPIIRNHLTHIAAPQPNRVSPLATAKGPPYEDLELVNGQPQPKQQHNYVSHGPSRPSSASPPGGGTASGGKKKGSKKRKRNQEPLRPPKRRRDRNHGVESAGSPVAQSAYIKNEPVSPPPFYRAPEYATNGGQAIQHQSGAQVFRDDRVHPRDLHQEQARSGLRYEYVQPVAQPTVSLVARAASPYQRLVQRDSQDLRRIASLQHAQRAPSPPKQRGYSPVGPYRSRVNSMTYGDVSMGSVAAQADQHQALSYAEPPLATPARYTRTARSRSPDIREAYRDPYVEPTSPSTLMPPPPTAPSARRVIVDQYGNQYMEAEATPAPTHPAPAPQYAPRASVAPSEAYPRSDNSYERAPSRMSVAYAPVQQPTVRYEPVDNRMPPPPLPARQPPSDQQFDYVDANGRSIREYFTRTTAEAPRYVPAPTSPIYQSPRGYEQMPPPQAPLAQPSTSPAYVRSYSVRPEEMTPRAPPSYVRQGSVAPIQYVRQEPAHAAPPAARAMSVMPGIEYGNTAQPQQTPQRMQSQAPQSLRYVDQYGNEVFPRQVSELR